MRSPGEYRGVERDFISATEQGKNDAWRYIVGTMVVLFFWLVLGSFPLIAAFAWAQFDGDPATTIDPATGMIRGVDPLWGGYLVTNLSFPVFFLGVFLAVRVLHGRGLRTLVTPAPSIRWRRVAQGFGLWLLLVAVSTGLEILLYPSGFAWNKVGIGRYALFVGLALIFTPIQTTTEELFFRGYLLQASGRVLPTRVVPTLVNGALFALPHIFNPELSRGPVLLMLYYFLMGAFFSWVTLRDGTAELALGAHASNNLFVALLINFEGSALQTPSLIVSTRFDPLYEIIGSLVSIVVFAGLLLHGNRDVNGKA
ncbi:MAG: CPBP family intramembrane glutamic endopeptidase [Anaerolineae bacterium]